MEPAEEAWHRTLVARCCCCFPFSATPSLGWVEQHNRLKERYRVAALRWLSALTLDPDDAGDGTSDTSGGSADGVVAAADCQNGAQQKACDGHWVNCENELVRHLEICAQAERLLHFARGAQRIVRQVGPQHR
eukprot:SAG31_NODE_2478_length_5637_cov_2.220657_5_plen_133_part_00